MNIEYNTLMNMDADEATRYYQQCRDDEVMAQCFDMGLQGINYKDSSKCGTDYYKTYLDEMEDRNDMPDEKTALYKEFGIKVKIKEPAFLFKRGIKSREILNG